MYREKEGEMVSVNELWRAGKLQNQTHLMSKMFSAFKYELRYLSLVFRDRNLAF